MDSKTKINTFFICICIIFLVIPIYSSSAISSVSLSAPAFANVGSTISITASTSASTEYIYIYVNGVNIKSCYSTNYCSTSYTVSSSITKYTISASAWQYSGRTVYTRLRFPIPGGSDSVFGIAFSTWYANAGDYARSPDSASVWDVTYKILTTYGGTTSISNAISAISSFAFNLDDHWASDSNSLTAAETASHISTSDLSISGTFDCSDMAAFLSGTGIVLGIPTRMISLSDHWAGQIDHNYQHMFTEFYGKSYGNNNGWYLIDPGHPGVTYTSATSSSTIVMDYTGNDGSADRFWFIWGMTSTQWGSSVSDLNRATSWIGWDPTVYWVASPHYLAYEPNPWSINSLQ